eukprot:sb/3474647/
MERQSREMEIQLGEDTKTIARQVEQITALNNRNKQLKQFLADSESRVHSLQSKLRKVTSEMEETEGRAATMSKLLSTPAGSRCGTPASSMRQSTRPGSSMSWDHIDCRSAFVRYPSIFICYHGYHGYNIRYHNDT